MKLHHLNCVKIESPFGSAIGHCTLIETVNSLTLIDTGIGINETREPDKYLGKELVEITGFQFDENLTAIKQIEKLSFSPDSVTDIICSHLDPDHIGGAVDFPDARIHVSKEEYDSFQSGDERYLIHQLSYDPQIQQYSKNDNEWFGLDARKLDLPFEAYLIPLFGHTLGHCGVVFRINNGWTFYVGDAYYLRTELENKNHPVDELATIRAVENSSRLESLEKVRKVLKLQSEKIDYYGYHDPSEFKKYL